MLAFQAAKLIMLKLIDLHLIGHRSGRPQFDLGVEYNDVAFYRFTLPRYQFRACDFGSFSIWCRYANAHFTTLAWNYTDVFVSSREMLSLYATDFIKYIIKFSLWLTQVEELHAYLLLDVAMLVCSQH